MTEVIHTFSNSSYFVIDSQKKCSTMFCVTLIQYFNTSVSIIHEREKVLDEVRFLEDNYNSYFTVDDYIEIEENV